MASTDSAFSGSIPALYDRCLGPMLFEPYAADMAERVCGLAPRRVLETAAGTGIVTERLARALPGAEIVATDLNEAMLDVGRERPALSGMRIEAADAQALRYPDASFDAVVCQFGVMFFPDRVGAYREALRVLEPGGSFLFNVWDSLDENPAVRAIAEAVAALFPGDPPGFLGRTPFGYHDTDRVERDLRAAGFRDVRFETVVRRSRTSAPLQAAIGLCEGSPLRAEIEARDASRLGASVAAAAAALASFTGADGGVDAPMSAHVFTARR
jgi:SAM-dependent methyltransferase